MFENIAKIPTLPYLLSGAQYLADQMQLDTGKFFSAALPARLKHWYILAFSEENSPTLKLKHF